MYDLNLECVLCLDIDTELCAETVDSDFSCYDLVLEDGMNKVIKERGLNLND